MRCPNCDSERVRNSRRRGVLETYVYGVVGFLPHRCKECDTRFLRRSGGAGRKSIRTHRGLAWAKTVLLCLALVAALFWVLAYAGFMTEYRPLGRPPSRERFVP